MKELRSPDVSDQVSESLELAPLAYVAGYIALACDEKVSHVHPVNIAAPLETKKKSSVRMLSGHTFYSRGEPTCLVERFLKFL